MMVYVKTIVGSLVRLFVSLVTVIVIVLVTGLLGILTQQIFDLPEVAGLFIFFLYFFLATGVIIGISNVWEKKV